MGRGVDVTAGRAPGRSQAGPHPLGGSTRVPMGRGVDVTAGRAPGRSQAGPHPLGGSIAVRRERGAVMSVAVVSFRPTVLPWALVLADEARFRRILRAVLGVSALI